MPRLVESDASQVLGQHLLRAEDPGLPGTHEVRALYYGSGSDRRRDVFRDSVSIVTPPVDATEFIDLGQQAKSRNKYWGFSPDAFPLNGRVWYPTGAGPFPIVLMVHGNHNPRDFSDPGYEYLGRLLASRGFIAVSVDMNFVNGGIRGENDARGWLLLKHLEAWRGFSKDPDGPFYQRVDLERVALIGHSRGGEAIAHAAAFNRLARYPDNGNVTFDFGFGIRALIAIAPVDGQYLPTGRHLPLEDVDYLVFHGSHDGDVTSFHGLRQYQRLTFSPGTDHFKVAVYVYGANHGQWNSVWNNKDRGPRSGRTLRLDSLIPPEDQRRFAEVYIPAFLETSLLDRDDYLPLFRDHRVAGDWLPGTMYVTRYQHSSFLPIATFEEDIDLTSGSLDNVRLGADSLLGWKETALTLRSRNRSTTSNLQQNQALEVSWDADSTGGLPAYYLKLPSALVSGAYTTLELLAALPSTPGDSLATPGRALDATIRVVDVAGASASVSLADYGPLRAPLDVRILRRNLDAERFESTSETVLQGFSIPLDDFRSNDPAFSTQSITEIRIEFDQTASGRLILDDIGLANPPDGFLRARIPPTASAARNDG